MAPPRSPLGRFGSGLAHTVSESFFRSLSAAGRLHPASRPERHGVEVVRDVPYVVGHGAGGGAPATTTCSTSTAR